MNKRFTLECPMPEFDFDVITLGHGSGGRLTNAMLERGIFSLFKSEEIQKRHDGAIIKLEGKCAFTTDSFVISPIFFPGSNIGELAVNGTVNDIAMCGAIPRYLSLSLIIEEGLKTDDLWEVLAAVKISAEKAGIRLVTGDTKVVEKGKGDKIFINTTGIGEMLPHADIDISRVQPEDKIIISGPMATHGMAIMSVREGLSFESDIQSDTRPLHKLTTALITNFGEKIKLFRDPTRGGVATVLNEIAQQENLGIKLVENQLPVMKQVKAACEILGLDPLYVANEGIFIAIVSSEAAGEAIQMLRKHEEGTDASIIGEVSREHTGKVYVSSGIGGSRVIGMLAGDQLPRIC